MSASALIIAAPGPLRDGLHALIGSMPQLGAVDTAKDVQSALTDRSDCSPDLVLVDADLWGDEVWRAVRRARARWSGARIIALVGSVEQQDQVRAAGADAVLVQGFPPGRLVAAIVRLLPHPVA